MNLKKTILAIAVAGITAAPMIASAAGHGPDSALYGSIRYGVQSEDKGGNSERATQFQDFGSRYGIKGQTDLGNGMTVFGHWEDGMVPRKTGSVRELKIGLKGDFGQVYAGDAINHTWDSYMSTDDSWWYGGGRKLSDGVQSNAITYMGGAGAVSFGITAEMSAQSNNANEEAVDAIEAVVAFDAGPVNIAVGMTDKKTSPTDTEAVVGLVVKGSAGDFGYAVDFQSQGAASGSTNDDASSFQLQGSFGSFYAQYGSSDTGAKGAASATPTNLV